MTLEIPTKKPDEVPPTCEELLGRVFDLPHRSGSVHVDAPASSLAPYIPKRSQEDGEEEEEKEEKTENEQT